MIELVAVERDYHANGWMSRKTWNLPEHRVVYHYDENGDYEYSEFIRREDSIHSSLLDGRYCGAV